MMRNRRSARSPSVISVGAMLVLFELCAHLVTPSFQQQEFEKRNTKLSHFWILKRNRNQNNSDIQPYSSPQTHATVSTFHQTPALKSSFIAKFQGVFNLWPLSPVSNTEKPKRSTSLSSKRYIAYSHMPHFVTTVPNKISDNTAVSHSRTSSIQSPTSVVVSSTPNPTNVLISSAKEVTKNFEYSEDEINKPSEMFTSAKQQTPLEFSISGNLQTNSLIEEQTNYRSSFIKKTKKNLQHFRHKADTTTQISETLKDSTNSFLSSASSPFIHSISTDPKQFRRTVITKRYLMKITSPVNKRISTRTSTNLQNNHAFYSTVTENTLPQKVSLPFSMYSTVKTESYNETDHWKSTLEKNLTSQDSFDTKTLISTSSYYTRSSTESIPFNITSRDPYIRTGVDESSKTTENHIKENGIETVVDQDGLANNTAVTLKQNSDTTTSIVHSFTKKKNISGKKKNGRKSSKKSQFGNTLSNSSVSPTVINSISTKELITNFTFSSNNVNSAVRLTRETHEESSSKYTEDGSSNIIGWIKNMSDSLPTGGYENGSGASSDKNVDNDTILSSLTTPSETTETASETTMLSSSTTSHSEETTSSPTETKETNSETTTLSSSTTSHSEETTSPPTETTKTVSETAMLSNSTSSHSEKTPSNYSATAETDSENGTQSTNSDTTETSNSSTSEITKTLITKRSSPITTSTEGSSTAEGSNCPDVVLKQPLIKKTVCPDFMELTVSGNEANNVSFYQYCLMKREEKELNCTEQNSSYWKVSSENETSLIIKNLTPNESYILQLWAVNNETGYMCSGNRSSVTVETNITTGAIEFNVSAENGILSVNWDQPRNFSCSVTYAVEIKSENVTHRLNTTDNYIHFDCVFLSTTYYITLTGLTLAGPGEVSDRNYTVENGVSCKPKNVIIKECDKNSCNVAWEIEKCAINTSSFIIKMNGSFCGNILGNSLQQEYKCKNLSAFTFYEAEVVCESQNLSSLSPMKQTSPTQPSGVDVEVNCEKGTINWTLSEPNPGVLEYFSINLTGIRHGKEDDVMGDRNRENTLKHKFRPEFNYTVWVSAKNKDVTNETTGVKSCIKKAESPLEPETENLKYLKESLSSDATTAEFTLSDDLFSDVNGDIINFTVYLYQKTNDKVELQNRTWSNVWNKDKILPYQATPNNWNPFKNGCGDCCTGPLAGKIIFYIGCKSDCLKHDHAEFCNGELRTETSYMLVIRAYTRGGYNDTPPYEFYTSSGTKKRDVEVTLTVCFLFILLSLLSAFFLHNRRKDIKSLFRFCPHHSTDDQIESPVPISNKSNIRPIPVEEFQKHYQGMVADSGLKFSKEFEELKSISPSFPCTAAHLPENRSKNRWINILPFDHSRVKLLPVSDDESSTDYINASYIPGYSSQREFIATQGPLPQTKDDFWRMVWEQSVQMIVMVTQCVERGKVKCEQYWPENSEITYYGDVAVQMRSESMLNGFTIRIFDLHLSQANSSTSSTIEVDLPDSLSLLSNIDQGTKNLEVKQMHFTRWPDFGCPENTKDLINFVQAVREYAPHNLTTPIIIHCSAGVGRTGTFIAVDRLMQHIQNHSTIDVYGTVLEMRNFRTFMVQTEDQYIYIHSCMKDFLESRYPIVQKLHDNIYENFPVVTNQDSQL